jgi:mycothiol system anti-sigma-R factor
MNVNCREVVNNLYLLMDGELAEDRCVELRRHIEACVDCLSRRDLEAAFKELVRRRCSEGVPEGLVNRLKQRLQEETL